ncbi:unnamed protein product [Coffea canephora]|uniref:Uncharacterized protein n=1 Tax=Coffea canephora TaxID=49390 RepID=A0A068TYK3_COFCA|nr:unnamed protein product [Coffea canephora]
MTTKARVLLSSAFLLALILSYEIVSSGARPLLKPEKNTADGKRSLHEKDFSSGHARILQSQVSFPQRDNHVTSPTVANEALDEADGGDDVRSTTPGRSPGVGHKV